MNNNFNYFVCPSAILKETVDAAGMTHKELSARTGISEKHITSIMSGNTPISTDIALKLEPVLKVPASFWLKLEADYAEFKENKKYDAELEADKEILKTLNYLYFKNLLNLKDTTDKKEQIEILRDTFSVSSLSHLLKTVDNFAAKTASKTSELTHISAAWVLATELLANRKAESYDILNFKKENKQNLIKEIKNLTLQDNISDESLTLLFAKYGIIFVATPYLKKSNIRAAVKKLSTGNYMIAINDRNKQEDFFWFSLAHEIAHIFCGHISKNKLLLSLDNISNNADIEREADIEASSYLISNEDWAKFTNDSSRCYTTEYIMRFSNYVGVCPAIVVGRLQHEKIIPYTAQYHLKRKIKIQ